MIFTVNLPSTNGPPRKLAITLAIHGRQLDALPGTLLVSVNGYVRTARWREGQLVLDRSVAMESDFHSTRIIERIAAEDLPHSARAALDIVSGAGAEAGVERCDLCGMVFPASRAAVHALCACPRCVEGRRLGSVDKEPMF
jgi:hypothetical protein